MLTSKWKCFQYAWSPFSLCRADITILQVHTRRQGFKVIARDVFVIARGERCDSLAYVWEFPRLGCWWKTVIMQFNMHADAIPWSLSMSQIHHQAVKLRAVLVRCSIFCSARNRPKPRFSNMQCHRQRASVQGHKHSTRRRPSVDWYTDCSCSAGADGLNIQCGIEWESTQFQRIKPRKLYLDHTRYRWVKGMVADLELVYIYSRAINSHKWSMFGRRPTR